MVDLTPRTEVDGPELRRRLHPRRRATVAVFLVVVIGAAGFLVVKALGDATQFFRNVDEAVADRDDLGERRFRLQGRVVPASVASTADGVTFDVVFNCVAARVHHVGDPPELFDNPWIPVVVVGSWAPEAADTVLGADTHVFQSDQLIVKHTNEYAAENAERVASEPPPDQVTSCAPSVRAALEAAV